MSTTAVQPFPLVRRGDREHPVHTVQYLLRAQGQSVAVDGVFGPQTEGAVRAFQQSKGLAVDGIVGPNTWSVLIIQVRRGSRGDAVRGVQHELFIFRDLSGDPDESKVDGIFGPFTEDGVLGFQEALAADDPTVAVDGIVGPVTWRALVSGMLSF